MKRGIYHWILMGVFILSIILLAFQNSNILTGHAIGISTPSNVSIVKSLAISFSSQLASGIVFEEVRFLPATDVNATHNYDGVDNSTQYFILVSPDGNTPVDLCLRADGPLSSSGGDTIPLIGESYSHSLSSNMTLPDLGDEVSFTTNYTLSASNVPIGGQGFLRFFLDVPAAQAPGTYNNSIYFKGTTTGVGC